MKALGAKLTYANVVSTLCLFLVLGGGAAVAAGGLGRETVGSAQLKKNAVTTAKLKNGAVTGAKINVSTLPTVPFAGNAAVAVSAQSAVRATTATEATRAASATDAGHATNADQATHATAADTATHATSANEATHATEADTAANASKLGNLVPSYFAPASSATRSATISAAGTLIRGQGVTAANVSRTAGTSLYCIKGLEISPTAAVAQVTFGNEVGAVAVAETEYEGCQVRIGTYEKSGGSKTFPFTVIIR